jgi:hypothetical protein
MAVLALCLESGKIASPTRKEAIQPGEDEGRVGAVDLAVDPAFLFSNSWAMAALVSSLTVPITPVAWAGADSDAAGPMAGRVIWMGLFSWTQRNWVPRAQANPASSPPQATYAKTLSRFRMIYPPEWCIEPAWGLGEFCLQSRPPPAQPILQVPR